MFDHDDLRKKHTHTLTVRVCTQHTTHTTHTTHTHTHKHTHTHTAYIGVAEESPSGRQLVTKWSPCCDGGTYTDGKRVSARKKPKAPPVHELSVDTVFVLTKSLVKRLSVTVAEVAVVDGPERRDNHPSFPSSSRHLLKAMRLRL